MVKRAGPSLTVALRALASTILVAGSLLVATEVPAVAVTGTTRFFAEGTVREGFGEIITIQNMEAAPSTASVRLFVTTMSGQGPDISLTVSMLPLGSASIRVDQIARDAGFATPIDVAARVDSPGEILVERLIYFQAPLLEGISGATESIGVVSPALQWWFAEGTIRLGFQQFVTLFNPNLSPAITTITYFLTDESGAGAGVSTAPVLELSPGERRTIDVTLSLLELGVAGPMDIATWIQSDAAIVAERPMYFRAAISGLGLVDGDTTSSGEPEPSTRYFFAEGTVRCRYQQYLIIQNPSFSTPATVSVDFHAPELIPSAFLSVSPGTRVTLDVSSHIRSITPHYLDLSLDITSDLPIVAERSMYFNVPRSADSVRFSGGTANVGAPSGATRWRFMTSRDHPLYRLQMIYNTSEVTASVTKRSYADLVYTFFVPPKSRSNESVTFGGFSTELSSTVGSHLAYEYLSDVPIVVERGSRFGPLVSEPPDPFYDIGCLDRPDLQVLSTGPSGGTVVFGDPG